MDKIAAFSGIQLFYVNFRLDLDIREGVVLMTVPHISLNYRGFSPVDYSIEANTDNTLQWMC